MEMEIYFDGNKKVNANFKGFTIKTDQPLKAGGDNTAPAPFDLFLASLGTCAGFYVKSFCDQRQIPTDNIKLIQSTELNRETHLIGKVNIEIKLPADFPDKYKQAVINAANLCTVKKHLFNPPVIEVVTSSL